MSPQDTQGRRPTVGDGGVVDIADRSCRALAQWMIVASGWGMLALGFLVSIDVVLRKLTGANITGVDEIAGYLFAIGISWSLAAGFYARSHIRIDVVYQRLAAGPRALFDLLAIASLFLLSVFLIYSSWLVLETSWLRSSRSASSLQIPLVIPQAIWAFGMLAFAASLGVAFFKSVLALASGNYRAIADRYRVVTPGEEAEEAVQQSLGKN
ncbi:TRAP transporter small permease subunit [Mesorhizobium sp. 1B3]|uniref:TRAP transporter small permease subunit n=1 Tax=Mesorhizobium sp. 1B3 TaxID=3243599 RepID=UPI003D994096